MLSDRVYDRCFGMRRLFWWRSNVWVEGKVSREQVYQVLVHRHGGREGRDSFVRLLHCECQLAVQVKVLQHTLLRMYLKECKSLFAKSLTACTRYREREGRESGGLMYRQTLESDL